MGRFDGRGVVVVGGGQSQGASIGNGRAASVLFAREGAAVLVVDRDDAAAHDTVEEIRREGGSAFAHQLDVRDLDGWDLSAAVARDCLGSIEVVVYNVGVVLTTPTVKSTADEWQSGFDINLRGAWRAAQTFLPLMQERGSGSIVNISSIAALTGGAGSTLYGLTKHALNALTRGLALASAPYGVRVNAIAPGMIDTPIGVDRVAAALSIDRTEIAAQRAAMVPMRRQGTAWDVAKLAAFLASDDANYITGTVIPLDGGISLLNSG
jgi:NAD(P)-dependent dehydrogenase (short-subunit alcohol dehydrogenase family)